MGHKVKWTFVSLCMVVMCGLLVVMYTNNQTFSLSVKPVKLNSRLIRSKENKEATGTSISQNVTMKLDERPIVRSPNLHIDGKHTDSTQITATARIVTIAHTTDKTHTTALAWKRSTVKAVPPLHNDEPPIDINFNIDRKFTIGTLDKTKTHAIPKRIHFMWNNETVPAQFVDNLKSFLVHNPDWEYYFWTLERGRALIRQYHPEFLPIFDNYPEDVNRADALRYIFMYHFGGAYFDLDTLNLRPLDAIINGEQCMVSPEPIEHSVFAVGIRSLLGNAVFLCTPKHGFFKSLIDGLPSTRRSRGVLLVAGPMFYTNMFNKYIVQSSKHHSNVPGEQIRVVSCRVFLDKVRPNIHRMMTKQCPELMAARKARFASSNCHLLIRSPKRGSAALAVCKEFFDNYMRIEACLRWEARGGPRRTISSLAVNDHTYYGTYLRPKSIVYSPENHIKNIIPTVKLYSG